MASEQAISCEVCSTEEGFVEAVELTLEGEFGPEEVGVVFDATGLAHSSGFAQFDEQWNLIGHGEA